MAGAMTVGELNIQMNLELQRLDGQISKANEKISRMGRSMKNDLGKNADSMGKAISSGFEKMTMSGLKFAAGLFTVQKMLGLLKREGTRVLENADQFGLSNESVKNIAMARSQFQQLRADADQGLARLAAWGSGALNAILNLKRSIWGTGTSDSAALDAQIRRNAEALIAAQRYTRDKDKTEIERQSALVGRPDYEGIRWLQVEAAKLREISDALIDVETKRNISTEAARKELEVKKALYEIDKRAIDATNAISARKWNVEMRKWEIRNPNEFSAERLKTLQKQAKEQDQTMEAFAFAAKAGGTLNDPQTRETWARMAEDANKLHEAISDELLKRTQKLADYAAQVGDAFGTAFEDAILSGDKLSKVLKNLAQDVLRIFVHNSVSKPIADMFGNMFSGIFGGGKAGGGDVRSGKTYLVGEDGPELFTPKTSGSIIPNGKVGAALAGGGGGSGLSVTVIQNFQAGVSQAQLIEGLSQTKRAAEAGVQEAWTRRKGAFANR